ncbi:TPA: site-specific integrase [Citrobacter koseri]|nr:site-specific integrase [Citrobacter koseri]
MKKYSVNSFVFESGERFCHVIDKLSGEPVYYPNLYILTQVRNRSNSINTMLSIAGILVLLHRWFSANDIDIEERVLKLRFLNCNEIDSLCDYMSMNFKIKKINPAHKMICTENTTKYFRLSVVCDYLEWFCQIHLSQSNGKGTRSKIDKFIRELKNKKPLKKERYKKEISDKALSRKQLDLLFSIVKPGSELNPFTDLVQARNRLMILMLFSFGIRAGELLNLRVSDIDFFGSTISIKRRANDKSDPRRNQPLVKTGERIIPVGEALMGGIYNYITMDRNKINNSQKNDFVFITYKAGDTNGMPLSISAYHKIINLISKSHPELSELCGHQLRHTWNYEFSMNMDEMNEGVSQEREEQIRSYLMGWSIGSETARIYNRRHIIKEAHKTSLIMQQGLMRGCFYE